MDFSRLKIYGFPRHVMQYKIYNPRKIRYLKSKQFGYFETPKYSSNQELKYLVDRYKQRVEYEKYFNPKGYKITWTSKLPKTGLTIDYVNLKCYLVRTNKEYESDNLIKFLVDKKLSKIEIKQFIEKLYNLRVNNISTAILPGKVKRVIKPGRNQREFMRTRDVKKALVELDFKAEPMYRKVNFLQGIRTNDRIEVESEQKFENEEIVNEKIEDDVEIKNKNEQKEEFEFKKESESENENNVVVKKNVKKNRPNKKNKNKNLI
jgi:ribosomal protein L23